jgi:hypothetical protein
MKLIMKLRPVNALPSIRFTNEILSTFSLWLESAFDPLKSFSIPVQIQWTSFGTRIAPSVWRGQESGSNPMRLNFYRRFIFFLLSVGLISFHRFITLEQELEGQLRGRAVDSTGGVVSRC